MLQNSPLYLLYLRQELLK